LVSLLATDEIEAVTAHEAGHLRLHHRGKDLVARILLGIVASAGFRALAGTPDVTGALGLSHETPAVSKADAVAKTRHQRPPRRVRQVGFQDRLRHQLKAHRQAGGDT
jgi:hypothetical protein